MQVWLPLLFALTMIAGMFFGYKLNKTGNSKGFFNVSGSSSMQEVMDLIQQRYVDKVNLDSVSGGAIREMMNELDPHSVYFPPVELKAANEDLAGNFEGIGVEFNIFSDTVNVTYVMPGGPSEKAGLQIGDKILAVNDSSLTGRVSFDKIRGYIRGRGGSVAMLKILRGAQIQSVEVKRGSIPVSSIDAAYMIDKTTGYIKLNKFTANSYEEFMAALEELQKQG
ncbi:MAG TPA: PDZ domain-containing protein, partial [Chitinophagaceae bacterium]|nr:PDZ domain-containing protein [Chitinophagaceae bacterium]